VLTRHRVNGEVDGTFGALRNGSAFVDFGGDDRASDLIQTADGSLVVAGTSIGHVALAKFTRDGELDPTFGFLGKVIADPTAANVGSVGLARLGNRLVVSGGKAFKTMRFLDTGANVVTINDGVRGTAEGSATLGTFVVQRSELLPVSTKVFFTIGGTASAADYTLTGISAVPTTKTLPNGRTVPLLTLPGAATHVVEIPANTTFAVVTITATNDNLAEGTENAVFTMKPSSSYTLGSRTVADIAIADPGASPSITGGSPSVQPKLNLFSSNLIAELK
jgi:hypothetical protein